MSKQTMMTNYSISLIVNIDQIKERLNIENNETFDDFIAQNFISLLNDKLTELNLEGYAGFSNYAHVYLTNK